MEYPRLIEFPAANKSVFLFGPRLTGKTYLLKKRFSDCRYYDLLKSDTFLRLVQRPSILREELATLKEGQRVIIDEIQKFPQLLDEIHGLIEDKHISFIITGSSARKLRRGGVNLLGGRARILNLHPLVSAEIGMVHLERLLLFGSLPAIYTSEEPIQDLHAYCGTYLQEEIAAESAVRKLDAFSRFLRSAALFSGQQINYEAWASDAAVPARTVREYFYLLSDTLIGETLEPWRRGKKRKAAATGKFYFFDIGVRNALANIYHLAPGTAEYGKAFEHFIYQEVRAFLDYTGDFRPLTFWRTTEHLEVDFIIGDDVAIEVKSVSIPDKRNLKGLHAIQEEHTFKHRILVCFAPEPRQVDSIEILPYQEFLNRLWNKAY
ncbi:MAG: AAA family ATPase [Treponema sp.]|nr:AAA family ATPase [Treponema sp.]